MRSWVFSDSPRLVARLLQVLGCVGTDRVRIEVEEEAGRERDVDAFSHALDDRAPRRRSGLVPYDAADGSSPCGPHDRPRLPVAPRCT